MMRDVPKEYGEAVENTAALGYYPAVAVEMIDGFAHMVCANGHRWGSINPGEGCPVCKRYHEFRLAGRTECEEPGCDRLVECSDKLWESGVRKCKWHWQDEGEYKVAPVTTGYGPSVLAEFNPRERWNGWLCPWFDAWGAQTVLEHVNGEGPDEQFVAWEWREDGTLLFIDKQWQAEEPDYKGEEFKPNKDGLYDLCSHNWTWYEDEEESA